MATKFQQLSEVSKDIEIKWSFQTVVISSVVESCEQKRLMKKEHLDGTKMLKMLLMPCCKTGHHLICQSQYSQVQKAEVHAVKMSKKCSW